MAREKKVTVKTLLNQEVKGRTDSPLEGKKYPLYIEITYNRKYTKFPFGDNWFPLSSADQLTKAPKIIKALKAVEKIVQLEISRDPDFTVTGVAKTIKSYLSPFQMCLLMLLIQHIGIEVEEKLPSAKFKRWQSLEPSDKIPEGLDLLGKDGDPLINDLLSTFQLLTLMEFEGSIVTWLVYTSAEAKDKAVEKGLDALKSGLPPYAKYGGIHIAKKKMSTPDLVAALDQMAFLVTDNQVSVSVNYV
jgi:hypothetical protein